MKKYILIGLLFGVTMAMQAVKLTIVPPNNGTIYALDTQGHRYDTSSVSYTVSEGDRLVCYALPYSECYFFSSWNPIGATMSGDTLIIGKNDVQLRAMFLPYQYAISADVSPIETGSVVLELGLGDIYMHLSGPVNCGVQVRLTATPTSGSGYHFARWNDGNTDAVRMVNVDGDANYTAIFENGKEPVGIVDTEAETSYDVKKYLDNGHVVIEINGKKYVTDGRLIHQ